MLALGLGGLRLTGGALAKLARSRRPLGDGARRPARQPLGQVGTGSSSCCISCSARQRTAPPGAAVGEAPAGLAGRVARRWRWPLRRRPPGCSSIAIAGGDGFADALTSAALFDALWPVTIGAALAALALRRWGGRPPAGLSLRETVVGAAWRRAFPQEPRRRRRIGARRTGYPRQWPQPGPVASGVPSCSARRPCLANEEDRPYGRMLQRCLFRRSWPFRLFH